MRKLLVTPEMQLLCTKCCARLLMSTWTLENSLYEAGDSSDIAGGSGGISSGLSEYIYIVKVLVTCVLITLVNCFYKLMSMRSKRRSFVVHDQRQRLKLTAA